MIWINGISTELVLVRDVLGGRAEVSAGRYSGEGAPDYNSMRYEANWMHPPSTIAVWLQAAAAVLVALACCSCTIRPLQGVLIPTNEAVEGTWHVPILVATTRTPSSTDAGEMFSRELSTKMSFGQVTVSIPPDHSRAIGDIQWPATPPGDPRRDFVTASAEYFDRAGFAGAITTVAKAKRRSKAMVFVHGFNNRFDDAVYRFAQFVQDGRLPVVPILFSWPSQAAASLGSYEYDRKVAMKSGAPLEQLLDMVNSNPSIKEITLVCHSMGCLVALDALHMKALRGGRTASKVKNLALVAPDVEFELFRSQVKEMGARRPRIGLFLSQDDVALKVSKSIWGGSTRLGDINPEEEPYKSEIVQEKILVFDLTRLAGEDPHSRAFDEVSSVMGMLERRLAQGQRLGEDTSKATSAR